jgi:hypothetical protein
VYLKIEITLPISPSQVVLLNKQQAIGYIKVSKQIVDELNRRTCGHAHQYFINHKNEINPFWLYRGVETEDSWDKTHGTGTTNPNPSC